MLRLLFASLVLVASSSFAGVTITSELTHDDGGTPDVMVMSVEGARARFEASSRGYMLWDSATKQMTMVMPATRQYLTIGQGQMNQVAEQMAKVKEQMAAALEKMPPEQRAKYEAMMQKMQGMPAQPPAQSAALQPWVFKATGAKEKVAGFECNVHRATRGDEVMDVCTVPWAKSPLNKGDLSAFKPMADFGQSMAKSFGGAQNKELDLTNQVETFPGYPVRVHRDGIETKLKSVSRGAIPASAFAVPEGFTEKTALKEAAGH